MLLRLLKNNRSTGIIFIFVLMIMLYMKSFLNPLPQYEIVSMPVYNVIFGFLQNKHIATTIVSMALNLIILYLLIRLNVIHFLLEDRSFMPATFFLLISATFQSSQLINPILVSSLFLILALLKLTHGDKHRANPIALFNSTLLIAAGSLFYLKLIWFIPFLWITAAIIRPLKWRGIIQPILALLMMMIFYLTYFWVYKDDISLFFTLLNDNLSVKGSFPDFTISEWILHGYLFFLILISSLYLLSRFQVKKIIIRKIYQVFFFLFIYNLLFFLFISGYKSQTMSLLAIPLAYLFANYFHRKKTHWIHEVILWIWLGLIVYSQFEG